MKAPTNGQDIAGMAMLFEVGLAFVKRSHNALKPFDYGASRDARDVRKTHEKGSFEETTAKSRFWLPSLVAEGSVRTHLLFFPVEPTRCLSHRSNALDQFVQRFSEPCIH